VGKNWTTSDIPSQKGKVIIITGSNSGLGFEAAKVLSQKDATVIMAVRNLEKGKEAIAKIQSENTNAKLELMQLDLSDLNSVRSFSEAFHSKYSRLDILMNNAGVMFPPKREGTKQGFEIQFGTNHLGHFALTGLLLDLIKTTPNARVVTQSSIAHKMNGNIRFDDLNWEKSYSKTAAYAQSKLANLLFTYELDRLFKLNKIDAIATASHPGITFTNLFRSTGPFMGILKTLFAQKVETGTLPLLRAATETGLTGAEFFGPTKMMEIRGYPQLVKSIRKSYDEKLAKELWSVSETLTGITYQF
jgi:NAD(P)-dependent dehydrogenase (short-subunit alcohol dehydrogenase family)